jgi:hypothetical protein
VETPSERNDADVLVAEIVGERQHHPHDSALGRGAGGLADLPVKGGGRGVHDDALAVEAVGLDHGLGGQPDDVELANELDLHDEGELVARKRPLPPEHSAEGVDSRR